MAEVLSQSQIDELLNSMAGGGAPPPEEKEPEDNYKLYDFSSPKKFTNERMRLLRGVYDNYARLVALRLNGVLRTMCESEVITVEEQRYFEFNNMLSDTDVMTVLEVKIPGEGKALPMMFHASQKLVLSIIDRMLGSSGSEPDVDMSYTYTELEMAVYQKIMSYIMEVTVGAWSNYAELSIIHERLEDNPAFFGEVSLDEPVVIVMLNVKINEIDGIITVCVPGTYLTEVFASIEKKTFADGVDESMQLRAGEHILTALNKSHLEVKATIGNAQLPLESVYSLKVGDVIDLAMHKDSDVTLHVEGQPWFEGKLGVYNKNTAVLINRRFSKKLMSE